MFLREEEAPLYKHKYRSSPISLSSSGLPWIENGGVKWPINRFGALESQFRSIPIGANKLWASTSSSPNKLEKSVVAIEVYNTQLQSEYLKYQELKSEPQQKNVEWHHKMYMISYVAEELRDSFASFRSQFNPYDDTTKWMSWRYSQFTVLLLLPPTTEFPSEADSERV